MLGVIGQAENVIAAKIKHTGFMPAQNKRRVPMETWRLAPLWRLRFQNPQFARPRVEAMDGTALIVAVEDVPISGIKHYIKSVCTRERDPIRIADPFFTSHCTWTNPIAVVLQTACDTVDRSGII